MSQQEQPIELISVWESQLFVINNPLHQQLKQPLLDFIYDYQSKQQEAVASQVAPTAKRQLFESELTLMDELDPAIQQTRSLLEELVSEIATEINQPYWPEGAEGNALITESWFHITQKGGYHDAHSHPNCSWCGIYYLDVGDCDFDLRSGVNRFYDPRNCADHYLDAGSQYLNSTGIWDVAPSEGQIVIFPSYLKHSALPYFGEKDRVILAFNCTVDLI